MGSFFVDNAPTNTGVTGGTLGGIMQQPPPGAPNDPRVTTQPQPYQQGPSGAQQPQGDPKEIALQYAQSLGPPSPENIQKTADYMKSQGYNVQANPGSDGFFIDGVGVDMVSNFKGGGQQNWQWLPDSPIGGSGGNPNDPAGFQTGTFTGGGKYPLASVMGTGLAQPWTTPFQAPDPNTFTNDKPLQWQMEQGTNAITRGLAKNGTLLTGGSAKALDRYGQGVASQYYGDAYNRALGEYQNAYGIFNNNQGNLFNRLSNIGSVGENAAAGVGNVQLGAGDARAQGSIAQGNIWGNAINNGVGAGLQYLNQRPQQQQPDPNSIDWNAAG